MSSSTSAERYLDLPEAEALNRLRGEVRPAYITRSPVYEITFPAANTKRDVQHGMGAIPTGFIAIAAVGGNVRCFDLTKWTTDLAYLTADAANTRVRGYFVLTEVPIVA